MALGMEVDLDLVHIVLDGDTAPLPKIGDRAPKFSAHLYCRQTAGCIKMPLGTEVGLRVGLRDIVFDVDPATGRKKGHPPHPIFDPCLLWPNGWMDEDAAWYGSRPRPRPHCTRRGPSSRERGAAAPPLFSAHVYCGHGRPSQLLLSSCQKFGPVFGNREGISIYGCWNKRMEYRPRTKFVV